MRIAVAMSGGVDSAITAYLLKQQGHEIFGTYMKVYDPVFIQNLPAGRACLSKNADKNIFLVRELCEKLAIPCYTIDVSKDFKDQVLEPFKNSYLKGLTPNPCIWCNTKIKFAIFPEKLRNQNLNFDKFATGHYAKIVDTPLGKRLAPGKDLNKDQSYFLYRLNNLDQLLFPLGEHSKVTVRKIATKIGLKVQADSQDFTPRRELLLNLPDQIGNILDTQGKILGQHRGYWHYTIGQRKGLRISNPLPLYILSIHPNTNEIVVGSIKNNQTIAYANQLVWQSNPKRSFHTWAKYRSTQKLVPVTIELENQYARILFATPQPPIPYGQSIVFYEPSYVLGGGILTSYPY